MIVRQIQCEPESRWRPLINLWSVLEYLTKYTAKVGKATKHLGKLFGDVVATVCEYEQEDGVHDLWRRTIMKLYGFWETGITRYLKSFTLDCAFLEH